MKFGQTLLTHLTPEWRVQYILYNELKDMILKAEELAPSPVESSHFKMFVYEFDDDFFVECRAELQKVDTFFLEKRAEAMRKFREFTTELEIFAVNQSIRRKVSKIDLNVVLTKRKAKLMKLALSEYYLSLILLRNYQTLNCTGFRKILKKHDKKLYTTSGSEFYTSEVMTSNVYRSTEIDHLMTQTEILFTNQLAKGDRSVAMKHLRVPPFGAKQTTWGAFRLGLGLGAFICLFCFLCASSVYLPLTNFERNKCWHLHRASFLLIVYLFLFGINVYGWQKAGVNHVLIFEINPRDHMTGLNFMEISAYFGVVWNLSILSCFYKVPNFITPNMFALIVILVMAIFWLNPIPILLWTSRYWLMRRVCRIISAPILPVQFADFFTADQLCSLSIVFTDVQYFFCFFTSGWARSSEPATCVQNISHITAAIIYCLPSWWRMLQSLRRYFKTKMAFPFLVNVGKYASAFPVAGFKAVEVKSRVRYQRRVENPYFWCLIGCHIFNSVFNYAWDIKQDFGLFKKFSGENIFLRSEILYAASFYYFLIIEDLLSRFNWIMIYIIEIYKLMPDIYLFTYVGLVEIFRRYLWNYVRLENEHLNNVGQFRAVRDISLKLVLPKDDEILTRIRDERERLSRVSNLNMQPSIMSINSGEEKRGSPRHLD